MRKSTAAPYLQGLLRAALRAHVRRHGLAATLALLADLAGLSARRRSGAGRRVQ